MRRLPARPARRPLAACALLLAVALAPARAQERGAAALAPLVRGLGMTARVLMIGAHPDDEDTALLTWLARGRQVEVAFLSLTRGDGGQNLIGNELGDPLGAIRTEELLAARRLDGARQYFTRAYDFGFSKGADETLTQWPRDSILRDVLTVVRAFRPHVIVAVFSGTPADGHGHHQVAGLLAREAYDLAGDAARIPAAATGGFPAWTVAKFYRSAAFRLQDRATLRIDVGRYDPVLGRSYYEIAADSRSQHKSQAMGMLPVKGARPDLLLREAVRTPTAPDDPRRERDLLDGIDTSWARARAHRPAAERAALDTLAAEIARAQATLDLQAPTRAVPALARVLARLDTLAARGPARDAEAVDRAAATGCASPACIDAQDLARSIEVARARARGALAVALGLALEAEAPREGWAVGQPIPVTVRVHARGERQVTLQALDVVTTGAGDAIRAIPPVVVTPDGPYVDSLRVTLDQVTQPWWLTSPRREAMFVPPIDGQPESGRPTAATARALIDVDGVTLPLLVPVVHRIADPVRGEVVRPVAGAPAVSVTLDATLAYAPANTAFRRELRVTVRARDGAAHALRLRVTLPDGLVADSLERMVRLAPRPGGAPPGAGGPFGPTGIAPPDPEVAVTVRVQGRLRPGRHAITVLAEDASGRYEDGEQRIAYDHIRPQYLRRPARMDVEAVDLAAMRPLAVGYVPGVGDNLAPLLQQLGVDVTVLDPAALARTDLARFATIVVGPRAYEASEALVAQNARLLDFARAGGTLVVQYGQYEMLRPGIMPFPITLGRPADRVTVEGAPVRVVEAAAPVLAAPNAITPRDFDGWVQDRALYMPRTFDAAYRPVLEMADPGEPPNAGALLVAPLGRGTYVYTTLAFFRQLPAGHPGAARLFVNLLAARAGVQP